MWEGRAKEVERDVGLPDMTVGSRPWSAKAVCDHLCGEGEPGERRHDGAWVDFYDCPRCGGRRSLTLDLARTTVRCNGQDCMPRDLDYVGFLAEMEGLDFKTQKRAVQERRREIIGEAHGPRAASLTESFEQRAIEDELRPLEEPFTPEERRDAAQHLRRRREIEEEDRQRRERESRRREDESRSRAVLARVTDAKAALTWRELAIALPLFLGSLLAVYYGLAALQDFADYSPVPEGLQGFGIPGGGGEPDPPLVSSLRGLAGRFPLDWLVSRRFPVALLLAAAIAGARWLPNSLRRRRDGALRDGEYVGVYARDDEGKIRWR